MKRRDFVKKTLSMGALYLLEKTSAASSKAKPHFHHRLMLKIFSSSYQKQEINFYRLLVQFYEAAEKTDPLKKKPYLKW